MLKKEFIKFENIYFFLILILALSSPFSKSLNNISIVLLSLVWLIEGDFKRKFEDIRSSKVLISLCLFLLIIVLSLLYSSTESSFAYARKYIYFILIIVIATSIKKEWINYIINAFLLGMFFTILYAFSPIVFDYENFIKVLNNSAIDSQFFNPTMISIRYSIFLSFSIFIILEKISNAKQINYKTIFLSIFLCLAILNLLLSYSRTGQISFFILFIFWVFYKFKFNIKISLSLLLSVVVLFYIAYNNIDGFKKKILETKNEIVKLEKDNFQSSSGVRLGLALVSWDIIKENPLFGVGLGGYLEEYKKTINKEEFEYLSNIKQYIIKYNPHNQYILIALQVGIIGLFLFLYFIYQCFKSIKKVEYKEQRSIFLLFLMIIVLSLFTDIQLMWQQTRVLFIVFVGMLARYDIERA